MTRSETEHAIRLIERTDMAFLRAMLFEAVYWRSQAHRPSIDEGLADPELAKLLEGWGTRRGDTGVVALAGDARRLGAAWYRFWTDSCHYYGYIDPTIPEVAIGVLPAARRQGIGRALLDALIAQARSDGLPALSLSVDRDNGALKLYERVGFRPVATLQNSFTMLLDLLPADSAC